MRKKEKRIQKSKIDLAIFKSFLRQKTVNSLIISIESVMIDFLVSFPFGIYCCSNESLC
jgi:hypothetical protein